jgi:cysteine desulfurase
MIYLDANATEPLRPEARDAVMQALDITGNPSSVHSAGRRARRLLEDARESLARRFGASPQHVIFTSGGTEADALAVHALGATRPVIIGATEHDAIRAAAPEAKIAPVDQNGVVDLGALQRLIEQTPGSLVCVMLANNETGTIQPIPEVAALCRANGAFLHVDAVQAAGRAPVSLAALGAHSLAISSHKLGGPAGAGALLVDPEIASFPPLIAGGGQERGRRGGTPPVALIAGFAAAAQAAGEAPGLKALREAVEAAALRCGAVAVCGGARRLANTACLALPGIRSDAQVMALDLEGVAVSAGAACSSGKVTTSHVLSAMGLGPLAGEAIRVSLPWNATEQDVACFTTAYTRMADRLRCALAPRAA